MLVWAHVFSRLPQPPPRSARSPPHKAFLLSISPFTKFINTPSKTSNRLSPLSSIFIFLPFLANSQLSAMGQIFIIKLTRLQPAIPSLPASFPPGSLTAARTTARQTHKSTPSCTERSELGVGKSNSHSFVTRQRRRNETHLLVHLVHLAAILQASPHVSSRPPVQASQPVQRNQRTNVVQLAQKIGNCVVRCLAPLVPQNNTLRVRRSVEAGG